MEADKPTVMMYKPGTTLVMYDYDVLPRTYDTLWTWTLTSLSHYYWDESRVMLKQIEEHLDKAESMLGDEDKLEDMLQSLAMGAIGVNQVIEQLKHSEVQLNS